MNRNPEIAEMVEPPERDYRVPLNSGVRPRSSRVVVLGHSGRPGDRSKTLLMNHLKFGWEHAFGMVCVNGKEFPAARKYASVV